AGGPSRLRYFHPRDWVIGARAVLGDGTAVRSGGRVVKNVTGYDLTRFWGGTFGTLAAIVELTLKLTAIPERTVSLIAEVDVSAAFAAANDLPASGRPDVEFAGYGAVIYPATSTAYLLRSIDRATFRSVRASLEAAGGIAVLERASADYKRDAGGAWGTPRVPLGIARALKERF